MALKPLRFCTWPGCNELGRGTYCEAHQKAADEKRAGDKARYQRGREKTAAQGYDGNWQKARLAYLSRHPLCERCEQAGVICPAILVHHRLAIRDGGARLDAGNMMALCNDCHEAIHKTDRWKKRD